MSNPRKFSEKIAVQLQRQAEATAVIDEVLRDIREVTQTRGTNAFRQPIPQDRPSNHLQPQFPYPRGSSLPNISQMSANPVSTEYSNVHGFTLSHVPEGAQAILQVDCQHIPNHRRGGGGPLRHSPTDKRIVSSPYGSLINHGTYLSPPLESTWARRASSDSALHQTSMGPDQSLPGILCTSSSSRTCPKRGHPQPMEIVGKSPVHSFPRTSSQQSNTSGLHLGRVEIMEGEAGKNSTMGMGMGEPGGSLPDLTSIHMPSPLTTPIDVDLDCQNPRGSQSYNPSPVGPSSPLTFGSQNNYGGNGRFMVGQVSPSSNQSDDIVVRRNANLPPLRTPQGTGMCGNGTKPEAFHGASPSGTPTYTQSQLPLTMISSSPPASTVSGYRVNTSPSSPSGRGSTPQSPHSSAGSPYSAGAPPSPVTTSTAPQMFFSLPHSVSVSISSSALPSSSHQQQTISLQQHLEQCKMNDANSTPSSLPLHYPRDQMSLMTTTGQDPLDEYMAALFQSSGQGISSLATNGTTPQTPQTPSSIPEITLSDFSNNLDEFTRDGDSALLSRDLGLELCNAVELMGGELDSSFFSTEDALRETVLSMTHGGLTEMDLRTLNENIVTDPATEDHFRLDRTLL